MGIDGAGAIKLVFMAIVGLLCIDIALTGLLGSVIAAFIDPSALTDTSPGGGSPPPVVPAPPILNPGQPTLTQGHAPGHGPVA